MASVEAIPEKATFEQRLVKCGKPTCRCVREGAGHGPYWFAYWRDGDKVRSRYLGAKISKEQFATKRARARARRSKS